MFIKFESVRETVVFKSPLPGNNLVTGEIERRKDPLTGRVSILSSFFKEKKSVLFPKTDTALIADLAEKSRAQCFFCPDRVEQSSPEYPESLLPSGRIKKGQCILFPNLFPMSAIHAVITIGEKHHRDLNDFPPDMLADAISCAQEFIKAVISRNPDQCWFTMSANYLFPAGASIVHPHSQLMGSSDPSTTVRTLSQLCRSFREQNRDDYFSSLIETEEKLKERFIFRNEHIAWIAPFAPSGANEVMGILPANTEFASLDRAMIENLAAGLSKVLSYYHSQGFSSINWSIMGDAAGKSGSAFPVIIRTICRQNVYPNSRSDDYYLQKLLDEDLVVTPPEELATGIRELF